MNGSGAKRYELRFTVLADSGERAMELARIAWDAIRDDDRHPESVRVFEERTEPVMEQIGSIGVSRG